MKASEIKELTVKEIQERLDAERDTLVKLRMNHSISPLDNPSQIRVVRKNIARMLTELHTRQLNEVNN